MGYRRLIFLGVLCAICLVASSGWIYYLHSQWSSPERLITRAALAIQDNDLGRAQVLIRNAIKQAPDNVEARVQIANVLNALSKERRVGDVPAAVEQIAHAATLKPDDLELQTRLFFGWHRLGRKEVALATARKVVELGGENAIVLMYVVDADLEYGQLESAGKLLDRLSQIIPDNSPAVIVRRLRLMEASGDDAELESLCESLVVRLHSATGSELAAVRPEVLGMAPSVMVRYVQHAPDRQLASRSAQVIGLIRRLLVARPETENQWPLVRLAERLVDVSVQTPAIDPGERQKVLDAFVKTGKWLLNTDHYPRYLSPQFTVLLYHSAMVARDPEFAVSILPRIMEHRGDSKPWKPTDEQRDALIAYHLTAMAHVIGTDADAGAREGVNGLQKFASAASMANLFQALLAAHDGETDQARVQLAKAEQDTGIDRQLILAVRCRCDIQAANWNELADTIEQLEQTEVDERQKALLQAILGPPEKRRLTHTMALLESGRVEEADRVLKSLDGTEYSALGQLVRILHELQQGRIVGAKKLLDAAREASADRTEFVIADVAIAAAGGGSTAVAARLVAHLVREPENERVRLLLARWSQATGRIDDALTQYRQLIQNQPERLQPWVMAALLLQTTARQDELNSLLQQMSETPEVSVHAVRLRRQMASFGVRLRQNGSDFQQAVEAVDLLHEDASQSSADWKLMAIALRAISGDSPFHLISRLEFALDTDEVDPAAEQAILDRLEGGMLFALSDIAESDAVDMEQRIIELVETYPSQPGPRIAAIVYFANRNDVTAAWKHVQTLAVIDPASGRAQYWFARLPALLFRIDEAADQVAASLKLVDRPDTRLLGARIELFRDQPQRAIEHLNRLPKTRINQAGSVLLRFTALRRLDRHDHAANVLTELLRREPQHIPIWIRLSEHCEQEYGGESAIRVMNTALSQHAHDTGLRLRLLTLLVRHDHMDQARTLARQLAETPDHPESALSLAMTFLESGAIDAGEAWLQEAGGQATSPFLYAMTIYQQGKARSDRTLIERAGTLLEQQAQERPDSIPVLNNLAWILAVDLDHPEVALPIVERMLTLAGHPGLDPTFVDTVAEVFSANGRVDDALALVRRTVLRFPEDGVLRYHSGVLQLAAARTVAQVKPALRDLTLARRWTHLSPRRDARVTALLEQYGTTP